MKKLLPLLLVLLFLTSCVFSDTEEEKDTREKGVYPDLMMEDATFAIGQNGDKPIRLQGKSIIFYSKDNYAELEEFLFFQENENGEVILTGGADHGTVDISGNTIEFQGNVSFSKLDDGMKVEAEELYFNSESNEISAEGRVVVESKEGVFVGVGFRGDLAYSQYSFESIERGELRNE